MTTRRPASITQRRVTFGPDQASAIATFLDDVDPADFIDAEITDDPDDTH